MRPVAAGVAGLLVLCGCAADVGQTDLTLHQRAVFSDGTSYELGELRMSEVDNDRGNGPPTVPGNEVTVSIVIDNAGAAIGAGEVAIVLAYHGDGGRELVPEPVRGAAAMVGSGGRGRISKTFLVEDTTELFRTGYLRVLVEVADYPAVTFSGSIP